MTIAKRPLRRSSRLSHLLLGGLTASLFLVGLKLGTVLSLAQSQPDPSSEPSGGAIVNPPFQVHEIVLKNQAGVRMSLKDLRGRAVLLFFGYTHCPDVCPTTLADYTQIKTVLGTQASEVAFTFVSIDPERDSPGVMKAFLGQFDPDFIGLMGDEHALHMMAAEYGAYFTIPAHTHTDEHRENINSDNYFIEHMSPSFLIDPDGYLRMVYFYGTSPDVIARGIKQVLLVSH
jgi:protein SCO1